MSTPGYVWVETNNFAWYGASGKGAEEGTLTGDDDGTVTDYWVDSTYLYYIDSSDKVRRVEGSLECSSYNSENDGGDNTGENVGYDTSLDNGYDSVHETIYWVTYNDGADSPHDYEAYVLEDLLIDGVSKF